MTTFLEISSFIEPQVLLHRPTSSMTTSESSPESCSSWSELTNQLSASGAQSTSPRITYKDLNPEYGRFLCLVLALIPTSLGSNLSWGPLGLLWILSGPRVINSSPSYLVWSFVELRHSTDCHSLILTGENFENSQELQLKVMLLILWTNNHKILHYILLSTCFSSMLKEASSHGFGIHWMKYIINIWMFTLALRKLRMKSVSIFVPMVFWRIKKH